MPGTPLAEAFVRVRADTSKFKDDIRDAFNGVGDDFGKQFSREATDRLRDERGRFASAGSDLGDAAGDSAGEQFGRGLAARGAVQFGADGQPFVTVGRRIGDETGAAAGAAFGARFSRDANGRWHDERGRFVADAETLGQETGDGFSRGFRRSTQDVGGFGDTFRRIGDIGKQALEAMLPSLGRLTVGLGSTLTVAGSVAAGVATLGAAAASSAGYVVALAAELAPVAGLLAALPGVLLTGAAALTTWKLATYGVGSAMAAVWSGDAKGLEEALAKLTPAAAAFVSEFEKATPAFKDFQAAAQEGFFSQLSGSLAGFAQALGALKSPLRDLAGDLGGLVRETLNFATAGRTVGQFSQILGNTGTLVGALRAGLQPLLKGFVDLGTAGSNWLAGMSGGLTDVITRFGEWMTRIAESGQAMAWMDNALIVLKALGSIAKDVGGILTGVFGAARDAGTGALGVLGQLVDKLNDWVNSAKGQDVLVTVFTALDAVGRALVPVLSALGGAVAAIAPEAAKVATALGPVLAEAITVLGKGIAAMGPGLVKMVEGFGRMLTAMGPLEPLGAAVGDIFAALGGALALIVPEIAKIAVELAPALTGAIRALGPALAALGPGLISVAENLAKAFASEEMQHGLLALGKGLSDVLIAIAPLLPFVGQLAGILGQVLGGALTNLGVALGPIIEALAVALEPALKSISDALNLLIPLMEPIYKAFGDIGAALITQLLPPLLNLIPTMIDSLIPAFVQLAREVEPLIPLLADLAVKFVRDFLPALLPMLPELSKMSLEFARMGIVLGQLVADVAPYIERIIGIFQHLYDTLVGHSIIPDLINGMTKWFRDGVQWIQDIVSWFGKLPEMIGAWLGTLVDRVQAKWNEIKNAIGAKIEEIKGKLSDVLDSIKQKWSDIWSGLKDFVSDKFNEIKTAIGGKIDDVLGFIRDLPGRITGALGNLGGLLRDSGRSIIQGLIDGLYSKLQDAYNSAADILNRIRSLFPFSPAKEGPFSGKGWTLYSGQSLMAGLAKGILGQEGAITGALDQVLKAGAATLGTGLQMPVLAAMTGPTAAPTFADTFAAAAPPPAGTRPDNQAMTFTGDIVLNVQGVLDPRDPAAWRRLTEQIRESIRGLDREVYVNA